jgi:hypothetical protein
MKLLSLFSLLALSTVGMAVTPTIAQLEAQITSLQAEVNALKQSSVMAMAPFITVDPNPENEVNGPNITFHGANVHIVNGTSSPGNAGKPGLGNLIIGPNLIGGIDLSQGRQGSENLILGNHNAWTAGTSGAIISGEDNVVNGPWNAIIAGYGCSISGGGDVMVSGYNNFMFAGQSVMVSGENVGLSSASGVQFDVALGGLNTGKSSSSQVFEPTPTIN